MEFLPAAPCWLLSPEAYSLYKDCMYRPRYSAYLEKIHALLSPAHSFFLCLHAGKKVGILALEKQGNQGEILGLSVVPHARRQGFGRFLVLQAMKQEGLDLLTAWTDEEGVGFYQKCGFTAVPHLVPYPQGQVMRYACRLTARSGSCTAILHCHARQ